VKPLTPDAALLMITTTAAGVWMMLAGVNKKLLEWRRRERLCAGCGRRLDRAVCRTCAGS
jgi:NADH pyrophosphatase NudC (nudix superfamily)